VTDRERFDPGDIDMAWCPGCGNFAIRTTLMDALADEGRTPEETVLVSGIGQAAKMPHYVRAHFFNGLHGRALPPATAIKAASPALTVIAESGDGDMYGEGGNHFLHTVRRNPGIVNIVHNNMVYGLTKGQASPTSQLGFKTPIQVKGVFLEPFNPLAVAISLGASFVARAFAGDRAETRSIFRRALTHKGYALIDVFQPCVSFNKINTYEWFKEQTYYLDDDHDPRDRAAALEKAFETGKLPLGLFYLAPDRPSFEETTGLYERDERPLHKRTYDIHQLQKLIDSKRT
jgi:2-oxoglutarate ferredoxin oxidoreductase subunit beta